MSQLRVEGIFRLTSRRGVTLVATVDGVINTGDRVSLLRGDGTKASGRVLGVDFHQPVGRPDQFGIIVDGAVGAVVRVGDILSTESPDDSVTTE